jgi:hypothetical protein
MDESTATLRASVEAAGRSLTVLRRLTIVESVGLIGLAGLVLFLALR